jgi:peroxiredoxin family protein
MPPDSADAETGPHPKKLSIILYSGTFDRIHYALVMASATAALGIPVTVFFTMDACRALQVDSPEDLPAWRHLPIGEDVRHAQVNAGEMNDGFKARGVATFEDLLEACIELEVRFMVCEMGLIARDMNVEELRTDIPFEVTGFVSFLMDARDDGQMIFV